jgi:hypothetical protein
MTRVLSPKKSAALLRQAFADKGAAITHTESLDLIARINGYEAWSHLQKATASAKAEKTTAPHAAVSSKPLLNEVRSKPLASKKISLKVALQQQYGQEGEVPAFPRSQWADQDSGLAYWDWVETRTAETWWGLEEFEPMAPAKVTLPNGVKTAWRIEYYLTDRWGSFNDYVHTQKPGLALLHLDPDLLGQLQKQMWDEITFITRKDNQLGLLYEVEYASYESECGDNPEEAKQYDAHSVVVSRLLAGLKELEQRFPNVQFCVPDEEYMVNNRPSVWAFALSGSLDEATREVMGKAMLNL